MKLRNAFSQETRQLFEDCHECWWCGQNRWDAIHHILGRVSTSPLNCAPIHNLRCHIGNAALDGYDERCRQLQKTLSYLESTGYRLTEEDVAFIEKYQQYY